MFGKGIIEDEYNFRTKKSSRSIAQRLLRYDFYWVNWNRSDHLIFPYLPHLQNNIEDVGVEERFGCSQ